MIPANKMCINSIAIVSSLLVLARGASAQSAPPELTRLAPEGATPSSAVFCGQSRKYLYDGSIAVSDRVHNENGIAVCYNHPWAVYPVARAIERGEIRGWILGAGGPGPHGEIDNGWSDDEYSMDILLDVGWETYAAGGTCPVDAPETATQPCALNEVHAIGDAITPHNIINDGERTLNSAISCSNCSAISTGPNYIFNQYYGYNESSWAILEAGNHEKWGGTGAVVVHVEIDGWGPSRGCEVGDSADVYAPEESVCQHSVFVCDDTGQNCNYVVDYTYSHAAHVPAGWVFKTPWKENPDVFVYWPFPLSTYNPATPDVPGQPLFSAGQYVRIVGTLWKDEPHSPRTIFASPWWDLQEHANSCWVGDDDYTNLGGTLEVHSVDYITPLQVPPPQQLHTLAGYEICSKAGDWNTISHTFSMGSPPYRNSQPNVVEKVEGWFTNWSSLRPSADSPRYSHDSLGNVTIQVTAVDADPPAKFTAVYDAFWTCAPYCWGQCGGDDKCGGTCPGAGLVWCSGINTCAPAGSCCNSTNCSGCCDSTGACVAGTADTACGAGGSQCGVCDSGFVCSNHSCECPPTRPIACDCGCGGGASCLGSVGACNRSCQYQCQ